MKENVRESEYFSREDRQGITWCTQVRGVCRHFFEFVIPLEFTPASGRFLKPYSADDVLFGNTFDRPLKLPWSTGAVLKFMK